MVSAMIRVIGRERREFSIDSPVEVRTLMKDLKLHEESYILVRNRIPLTQDDVIQIGDEVDIMEIFSGGI